jgi:hypothetical protein
MQTEVVVAYFSIADRMPDHEGNIRCVEVNLWALQTRVLNAAKL